MICRRVMLAALGLMPPIVWCADVPASAPTDVAVTIYRAPDEGQGALALDALGGFALITETRTLSLPAGESRLRFPGVADGIETVSAILKGLPDGLLEKNRDAQVLSPATLLTATLGRDLTLVRTNRSTGQTTRITGRLRSSADGVVFESAAGIEALRCSGAPESVEFSGVGDLEATPTLSVRARSPRPAAAQVTLSYLARGFDWQATYAATLSRDERSLDLGAWVTLANSNGVSFPEARVAVVAGRLNREDAGAEPPPEADEIIARCWPAGTTSDAAVMEGAVPSPPPAPMFGAPVDEAVVTGSRRYVMFKRAVEAEQLGDLKLYRVPGRTGVHARQMKQVRLLDRVSIPVELLYVADLAADTTDVGIPAKRLLRTRNDRAHHLGLPLPAGSIALSARGEPPLLLARSRQRDVAVGEEFEISAGDAPDVQVLTSSQERKLDPLRIREAPLVPGTVNMRRVTTETTSRIEVSNARRTAVTFEARLWMSDDTRLITAEPKAVLHNGQPVVRVVVPGGSRVVLRWRTESVTDAPVRPR